MGVYFLFLVGPVSNICLSNILLVTEANPRHRAEDRSASHRVDGDVSVRLPGRAHDAQPERDDAPSGVRR